VFLFGQQAELPEEQQVALRVALRRLATLGLPASLENAHWRTCPYLRENGYGEVVIDRWDHSNVVGGIEVSDA
jgi:hypothetical protein